MSPVPAAHPADGSLVASGRCVAGRARWTDHWFGAVGSEGLEGGMDGGGGGDVAVEESKLRNKRLLVLCVLQWEQQDKAAEMGHRFPGRAGTH